MFVSAFSMIVLAAGMAISVYAYQQALISLLGLYCAIALCLSLYFMHSYFPPVTVLGLAAGLCIGGMFRSSQPILSCLLSSALILLVAYLAQIYLPEEFVLRGSLSMIFLAALRLLMK